MGKFIGSDMKKNEKIDFLVERGVELSGTEAVADLDAIIESMEAENETVTMVDISGKEWVFQPHDVGSGLSQGMQVKE